MIKPRVDSIGLQNGQDLELFNSNDPEKFDVVVRVMIGPSTGDGEESFDFRVCSPEWISAESNLKGHFLARRVLVLPYWNVDLIRSEIMKEVSALTGETWDELATQLCKIARWEFEDYPE